MFFFKKRPPQPLLKRRWRWARRASSLLHVSLVGLVVAECMAIVAIPIPEQPANQQIVLHAPALAEPPEPPPVEINAFTPHTENWLAEEAVDISHLEAAQADPRWTRLVEPDFNESSTEERDAASSFLSRQVMNEIQKSESESDEDKLARLQQLARQQNKISTEESVAQMNAFVGKLLNVGERASAPAKEPIAGEFELDSAQLHDVRREMREDGTFKYIAVLIDPAGRTQENEMPAAEGKSAFETFELIKQNPLLERVYRGVVMSLLDKMMKSNP
jgi:hypothetical protein